MKPIQVTSPNILLKQAHTFCNGQKLDYTLFGNGEGRWDRFRIAVQGFGEEQSCEFASDLFFALQLFERLVEGIVPPCTLSEIVRDQLETATQT